jgi:hypothetical protein
VVEFSRQRTLTTLETWTMPNSKGNQQSGGKPREYYYVSLPYYGHQVFRCQGSGAEDAQHREFYEKYFREHGPSVVKKTEEGPYTVLILSEAQRNAAGPNLMDAQGNPLTIWEALEKYGPRTKISGRKPSE